MSVSTLAWSHCRELAIRLACGCATTMITFIAQSIHRCASTSNDGTGFGIFSGVRHLSSFALSSYTASIDIRDMRFKLMHEMAMTCICHSYCPVDFVDSQWFDPWVARNVYYELEMGGIRAPQDHPT